jgi:regulatory protein
MIKPKETRMTCLQKSIQILSRREHSKVELRKKLSQYDYAEQEIEQTISLLASKNMQSDERFAQYLAKKHVHKSSKMLAFSLKEHTLSYDQQDIAMQTLLDEGSEYERALAIYIRKFGYNVIEDINDQNIEKPSKLEQQKILQKKYRFLLSKGFSYDIISKVIRSNHTREEHLY